ncbi:MAG: hypothetical protein HOW73_27335 [Polyangiaceae bacterium]|nr:hypothetical protein [Polyangiaceae bacterium]
MRKGWWLPVVMGCGLVCCTRSDELEEADLVAPPARNPNAHPPPNGSSGPHDFFAVRSFDLGQGAANGWAGIGYDRDGLDTHDDLRGHCRPANGSDAGEMLEDGPGGVDNSFAKNVVPMLAEFSLGDERQAPEIESSLNASVDEGIAGLIFSHVASGHNATAVDAFGYDALRTKAGAWAVTDESLLDPAAPTSSASLASGKLHFVDSYVTDGVWVSGDVLSSTQLLAFRMRLGSIWLTVPVRRPVVTFDAEAVDPENGVSTNGVVSGEISVDELVLALQTQCGEDDLTAIVDALRGAADLLAGRAQSPDSTCDAISFGLRFDAIPIDTVTEIAAVDAAPSSGTCVH